MLLLARAQNDSTTDTPIDCAEPRIHRPLRLCQLAVDDLFAVNERGAALKREQPKWQRAEADHWREKHVGRRHRALHVCAA